MQYPAIPLNPLAWTNFETPDALPRQPDASFNIPPIAFNMKSLNESQTDNGTLYVTIRNEPYVSGYITHRLKIEFYNDASRLNLLSYYYEDYISPLYTGASPIVGSVNGIVYGLSEINLSKFVIADVTNYVEANSIVMFDFDQFGNIFFKDGTSVWEFEIKHVSIVSSSSSSSS